MRRFSLLVMKKPSSPIKSINSTRARKTAKPLVAAQTRRATTFRLDPPVQAGLTLLQGLLGQPMNRLVNEAVRRFVELRTGEVEGQLEQVLERVRAYRKSDPAFQKAIAEFVDAEATYGATDPVEGRLAPAPTMGPAQAGRRGAGCALP